MPPGQQKGEGVSWDSPRIIDVWYLDFSKITAPLYAVLFKLTNAHFEKTPRHLKTLDRSICIYFRSFRIPMVRRMSRLF